MKSYKSEITLDITPFLIINIYVPIKNNIERLDNFQKKDLII